MPPEVTAAAPRLARPGRQAGMVFDPGPSDKEVLARILEAMDPVLTARVTASEELARAVGAAVAAGPFLRRILTTDPGALDVLEALDQPVDGAGLAADGAGLARWKRLEVLRLATRDLLGEAPLEEVSAGLSDLADGLCQAAVALAGTDGLAVVAMGKLGARELNYSSDIDLMLVGEGNPGRLLELLRGCWRVDLGLRPEGRDGPLVRSLASFEAYWDRWAQTWEFQALLKARPVAGDVPLGAAFAEAAAARVWQRPFGSDELRQVRALKARAEQQLARRPSPGTQIKAGPGGIRDIEFSLQLLQLVHGRADPSLRVAATLPALAALAAGGYVAPADAAPLAEGYRFLRTVEHRLQLWDDQQVYSVPGDPGPRARVARLTGFRDGPEGSALEQFDRRLRAHQVAVRAIHERLFFRPLLEAFTTGRPGLGSAGWAGAASRAGAASSVGATLSDEAAVERLSAFGFSDARRTRQAITELTHGFTRSSTLLTQLLPLLLDWLSAAPDPDLGLVGLRSLTDSRHSRDQLATLFRESPAGARQLCTLLGTGPRFVRSFERDPDALTGLADGRFLEPGADGTVQRARQAVAWREGTGPRLAALARFAERTRLQVAARDVLGIDDGPGTGRALSALGDAVVTVALEVADAQLPFAVIGMGRLGGRELAYGSDLDLLFVYDAGGDPDGAAREAERVATALLRAIGGETPATRIFAVDTSLRPEGRTGPLARSIDAYASYYERWAQPWERQALLRGRLVAGDPGVGERFSALARAFVWGTPLDASAVREIRRLKARMERERIPAGEDPQFHLKLGRGSLSDVEWTVQLLQLRHRVAATGTIEAVDDLVAAGGLERSDAAVLTEAYRFCEATRNRLHLVRDTPGDALPAAGPHLDALARSLATTPSELRSSYRRVTRRARRVTERLFYGWEAPPGGPSPG